MLFFLKDAYHWINAVLLYGKQKMLKSGYYIDLRFERIEVVKNDLFKQSALNQRFI